MSSSSTRRPSSPRACAPRFLCPPLVRFQLLCIMFCCLQRSFVCLPRNKLFSFCFSYCAVYSSSPATLYVCTLYTQRTHCYMFSVNLVHICLGGIEHFANSLFVRY